MRKIAGLCCVGAFFFYKKQFHSENLLVTIVIKMLVMFLVESLENFCVSIHIHSSAHIIITTVNYGAWILSPSCEDWGFQL